MLKVFHYLKKNIWMKVPFEIFWFKYIDNDLRLILGELRNHSYAFSHRSSLRPITDPILGACSFPQSSAVFPGRGGCRILRKRARQSRSLSEDWHLLWTARPASSTRFPLLGPWRRFRSSSWPRFLLSPERWSQRNRRGAWISPRRMGFPNSACWTTSWLPSACPAGAGRWRPWTSGWGSMTMIR